MVFSNSNIGNYRGNWMFVRYSSARPQILARYAPLYSVLLLQYTYLFPPVGKIVAIVAYLNPWQYSCTKLNCQLQLPGRLPANHRNAYYFRRSPACNRSLLSSSPFHGIPCTSFKTEHVTCAKSGQFVSFCTVHTAVVVRSSQQARRNTRVSFVTMMDDVYFNTPRVVVATLTDQIPCKRHLISMVFRKSVVNHF